MEGIGVVDRTKAPHAPSARYPGRVWRLATDRCQDLKRLDHAIDVQHTLRNVWAPLVQLRNMHLTATASTRASDWRTKFTGVTRAERELHDLIEVWVNEGGTGWEPR
jgi:hypothetical protein